MNDEIEYIEISQEDLREVLFASYEAGFRAAHTMVTGSPVMARDTRLKMNSMAENHSDSIYETHTTYVPETI